MSGRSPIILSDESHQYLARQMTERAAVAGPFHAGLYLLMVFTLDSLSTQTWTWWVFGGICLSSFLRVIVWRYTKRLVSKKSTRKIWRSGFAFTSMLLALCWTSTGMFLLQSNGVNGDTAIIMIAICGIAAVSIPSFSYDLPILLTFLQVLHLPMIVDAMASGHVNVTGGLLLFDIFVSYVAVNMHRFHVQTMHQVEVISAQKISIENLHNTMNTMVNSLDEAFLLIDAQGRFRPTESRRAAELFGANPSGRELGDVLTLPTEQRQAASDWLNLSFSGKFEFDAISQLGPNRLINAESGLIVDLRYKAMKKADGSLESIVLVAEDVTREVEAERQAQENVVRAEMILQVLKDPESFHEFLSETLASFTRMAEGRFATPVELKRELHTLKGGAGIFRMDGLAHEIHMIENQLRQSQENLLIPQNINHLLDYFEGWKIVEKDLIKLVNKSVTKVASQRTLEGFLASYEEPLQTVAKTLGKKVRLEIKSFATPFPLPTPAPTVLRTLVHILNNALDHGIEKPEIRVKKGKSEEGCITISCSLESHSEREFVKMIIADDGAGIDEAGLRSALIRRNPDEVPPSDAMELYQRIFDDSVSSRTEVTKLSGRGVGLDAVKAAAVNCGGRVKVIKSDASGTSIEVLLPREALASQPRNAA